ncbi:MAG TPA: hypothetical protein VH482_12690 [Thermomicrobiales bacterium]|jgi:hypothetical protein
MDLTDASAIDPARGCQPPWLSRKADTAGEFPLLSVEPFDEGGSNAQ